MERQMGMGRRGLKVSRPAETGQVVECGRRRTGRWAAVGLAGAVVLSLGGFAATEHRTGRSHEREGRVTAVLHATSVKKLAATTAQIYPALPHIGARFLDQVPAQTSQVVVVYGDAKDQSTTTTDFFERVAGGWRLDDTWRGHSGYEGWTMHKSSNDLKSPVGVFALTDAGGELPKPPGTQLPYEQSSYYEDGGTGFFGESLRDALNYVIAIDYNRVQGTTPRSTDYPLGDAVGSGVWLHVDHGGPTHACVSIPQQGMETLLEHLVPDDHPMIIMGDREELASGE
jgi:L,D-peptidoglycan transpeptidase YkuD (ErfK/YbiS/YcfS/YnhG family)